jgi:hypothetical protein
MWPGMGKESGALLPGSGWLPVRLWQLVLLLSVGACGAGDPEHARNVLWQTPPVHAAPASTTSLQALEARQPLGPGAVPPAAALPAAVLPVEANTSRHTAETLALHLAAAQGAWQFIETQYQPQTGLINSVRDYPYATIWDIASGLAALFCANRLGLLEDEAYHERMSAALHTLGRLPLIEGVAFNRNYHTATARAAGRNDREVAAGHGWSATDLGRLLVWLRIIADNEPAHAAAARDVAERLDFASIVYNGYLHGGERRPNGTIWRFQEGRLGYEQYAAHGFRLWGATAQRALDPLINTFPITVGGHQILADRRGREHLTSEPFVLSGLEFGWDPDTKRLAHNLLAIQQERYERTGQITMVSEDAVDQPPHYFYYYNVHQNGHLFAIDAIGARPPLERPRWISAKAAFGWHALLPGSYPRLVIEAVSRARTPNGWASGIYESTGGLVRPENVNTAAVILEAALYVREGRPLLIIGPKPSTDDVTPMDAVIR